MENDEIILDSTLENDLSSHKNMIYLFFKRLFDIIISLIGIIPLIILIIVVKIVYICSGDFKTIFYKHTRVGKNGKKFAKLLQEKKYEAKPPSSVSWHQ